MIKYAVLKFTPEAGNDPEMEVIGVRDSIIEAEKLRVWYIQEYMYDPLAISVIQFPDKE